MRAILFIQFTQIIRLQRMRVVRALLLFHINVILFTYHKTRQAAFFTQYTNTEPTQTKISQIRLSACCLHTRIMPKVGCR